MDFQERRNQILQFDIKDHSLAGNGYTRVLLQLCGYVGHGKSSFINSCIYALGDGDYENKAKASGSTVTHTMERISYQLTECITMVDNRGFVKMDDHETGKIYAQLGNFLPLNKRVKWKTNYAEIVSMVEDSDLTENYSDFVVPIFICSVKHKMADQENSSLKEFFKNCRDMTGVYPIVVLTHRRSNTYNELEMKFREAGAEQVHTVENYTEHDNMKTRGRCTDLLAVLEGVLKDVKFCLEQNMDPVRERMARTKFLLKFAHEFTAKEHKKEALKMFH